MNPQTEKPAVPYDFRAASWQLGAPQGFEIPEMSCGRACDDLTWVMVTAHDVEAASQMLIDRFDFHPLAVEDSLSGKERPHLHEAHDHLFLSAPAVDGNGGRVRYDEIGVFISERLILTVTTRPVPVVTDWFERWTRSPSTVGDSPALMLHALLDAIIDQYFPALDGVEHQAEAIETVLIRGHEASVKDIMRLKRRLLEMRRQLSPFRDIMNGLLRRDLTLLAPSARPYFQDLYDHTLRLLESIDLNRDILTTLFDAHLATVSNRLNAVMRTMTVIATVLMSAAFFTGLYGMNFKGMPELDWAFGYPMVWLAILLTAAVELWIFKKKGWM